MINIKQGRLWIVAAWFAAFFFVQCSHINTAGGGGSETINAKIIISDTIARFEAEIKPGNLLAVRIYSDQYRPYERMGLADSLEGDSASIPAWSAPYSGGFNIVMSAKPSEKAAFVSGVWLKQGLHDTVLCTLKTSFVFKGKIKSQTPASYILFIQGSPFYCISDTTGRFSIPDIPYGRYMLKTRPIKGRLFMTTNDYMLNTDSLGGNVSVVIEGD